MFNFRKKRFVNFATKTCVTQVIRTRIGGCQIFKHLGLFGASSLKSRNAIKKFNGLLNSCRQNRVESVNAIARITSYNLGTRDEELDNFTARSVEIELNTLLSISSKGSIYR